MPDAHLCNEIEPSIVKRNISLLNANIFRTFHLVENFLTLSFPWFISRQISLPNYLSLLFNIFSIWRTEHVRRSEIPSFAFPSTRNENKESLVWSNNGWPPPTSRILSPSNPWWVYAPLYQDGESWIFRKERLNDHYFLNDCLGKDGRKRIGELFPIKF